ncbi:(2Fe-2S)-binding protein [Thiomicrorhabdus sp.]|uniref:(2Fe-2S)-binding protein n=1 Tax=Thiomicrorhabdus sp. TaxID=2039724 RepID=UPI002AA7C70D|nr:(2Fe-2S)-binding protein [Thiomicrorhabdus sp.]
MSNSEECHPDNEQNALPRELSKNLSRNVCVCYDVPKQEIIDSVLNGAKTLDEVSNQTYACQGSGCCIRQVERLIELVEEHKEQLSADKTN